MRLLRNRHLFIADVVLLALAAYVSFVLRFEQFDLVAYWSGYLLFAAVAVVVTPLFFKRAGVYSRYWRYASVDEMVLLLFSVIAAVVVTSFISFTAVAVQAAPIFIPRSIPLVFLLLALAATMGPRLLVRVFDRYTPSPKDWAKEQIAVGVMGAGDGGAMIVRELQSNPQLGMRVVAFFDDDPSKHNVKIHRVPVCGDRYAIPEAVSRLRIKKIIIAMPTVPGRAIRDIKHICEQAGVETKIMPGMYELIGGDVSVNQLRDVDIADLLRRAPIQTDIAGVRQLLRGKRVLVTGGGGSIGSELCRQIWRCQPSQIILLGHGENSIFDIHNELRRLEVQDKAEVSNQPSRLQPVIADIRFADRIQAVFDQYRPEVVFHAAAHKHVPLMEANPTEAVTNNVLGTRNVVEAARKAGVEHLVMVSTDKAVNPTSIMGASKRVAELLVHQAATASGRHYVAVRFGNVLGSRGSVVHTFQRQIAAGGPVTVTDPEMRRYFMTIPEAVQLLLQASVLGEGGEVFLLDMGEPVKIVDLARDMIELSGLEVGTDIEIVFTGMRPGEKLFEELFVKGESYNRTRHEKIYISGNGSSFVPHDLEGCVEALEVAARRNDPEAILRVLRGLVPEYQQPSQSSGAVAGASGGQAPSRPVDAALPVDSKVAPAQRQAVSA